MRKGKWLALAFLSVCLRGSLGGSLEYLVDFISDYVSRQNVGSVTILKVLEGS